MKIRVLSVTAVALLAGVAGQEAIAQEALEPNLLICETEEGVATPADEQVIANWQATEEHVARLAILRAAVAGDTSRAWNLMAAGNDLPNRDVLLREILTVLNESAELNADLIAELLNACGNLIAQNAADVEPAAGDDTTDADFGGEEDGTAGENPNQLNTPGDTTNPASPVNP